MINYFFELNFKFKGKKILTNWIKNIIEAQNYKLGTINYIFVDDNEILRINQQYLSHNYYTDIITFNYNKENKINSDIYISIERVKDNSIQFKTDFKEEFLRVVIHGILHLLGYNDSTNEEKLRMREIENTQIQKIDKSKIKFL